MNGERCPVCDGTPLVLVAIEHPAMQRMILELLQREHGCWNVRLPDQSLAAAMLCLAPDLVIVDSAAFPRCCRDRGGDYPCDRVVVVGPEPDAAYMAAAFRNGAGGWVARDDVADRLSFEMRRALGCIHEPCPAPAKRGS